MPAELPYTIMRYPLFFATARSSVQCWVCLNRRSSYARNRTHTIPQKTSESTYDPASHITNILTETMWNKLITVDSFAGKA
jgi:hypothetical protein